MRESIDRDFDGTEYGSQDIIDYGDDFGYEYGDGGDTNENLKGLIEKDLAYNIIITNPDFKECLYFFYDFDNNCFDELKFNYYINNFINKIGINCNFDDDGKELFNDILLFKVKEYANFINGGIELNVEQYSTVIKGIRGLIVKLHSNEYSNITLLSQNVIKSTVLKILKELGIKP